MLIEDAPPTMEAEWEVEYDAEYERQAKAVGEMFAEACVFGILESFYKAIGIIFDELCGWESTRGWEHALKALSAIDKPVPAHVSLWFLPVGIELKIIAGSFDDPSLIKGLRKLMPQYRGPAVRLYRGAAHQEHTRGRYGFSWTSDLAIAEDFATDFRQTLENGSVILTTVAPSKAIIATVDCAREYCREREYLVDRRQLSEVSVLKRYPQKDGDEYLEEQRAITHFVRLPSLPIARKRNGEHETNR